MASIQLVYSRRPVSLVALVDDELFPWISQVQTTWVVNSDGRAYRTLCGMSGFQYNLQLNRLCWALHLRGHEERSALVRSPQCLYEGTTLKLRRKDPLPSALAFGKLLHTNQNRLDCRIENLQEVKQVTSLFVVPLLGSEEASRSLLLKQVDEVLQVDRVKVLEEKLKLAQEQQDYKTAIKVSDELAALQGGGALERPQFDPRLVPPKIKPLDVQELFRRAYEKDGGEV